MSFKNLKESRQKKVEELVEAAKKLNTTSNHTDDRLWKPTVDKAGNGYAVIRFLPSPDDQDLPWARYWDHGFQGPTGRWYIEKSLTSLGNPDPVSEMNSQLWNSGQESDKEIVRKRKRRLHYVSNILVVSDSANKENEGKIFLYEYGKKIFDKIMDVMQPQFEDEKPCNPFDFWEGANFKLKIRKVDGYRNYDKSEFDKPAPLFGGDDEKLESLYNKLYSLKEYGDASSYKSYSELKAKLYQVLGEEEIANTLGPSQLNDLDNMRQTRVDAPPPADREDPGLKGESEESKAGSQDDELSYFASLVDDE